MRIDLLTLFPEACDPFFSSSILGRAQQAGLVTIRCHNIRDHAKEPHRAVDDKPFGGGPGMVLMCQPVFDAVEAVEGSIGGEPKRILLTPQGERLDQRIAQELSEEKQLLLLAGHYEGFDERIRQGLVHREISIGDYVLSGGEAAAMVLVDAIVRLIPGALGDLESVSEESFSTIDGKTVAGLDGTVFEGDVTRLEYPQYTRPRVYRDMGVPEVLLSGDHGKIRAWRTEQSLQRTRERRPDLLRRSPADDDETRRG